MKLALAAIAALGLYAIEATEVDFERLAGFDYEEGMELPAKVKKLDGKTIKITGFMKSTDGNTEDVTSFWLVNQNCNCEGEPKVNELILCTMPDGEKTSIDDTPVEVVGPLEVGEDKEDGYVLSLYRLEVDSLN